MYKNVKNNMHNVKNAMFFLRMCCKTCMICENSVTISLLLSGGRFEHKGSVKNFKARGS